MTLFHTDILYVGKRCDMYFEVNGSTKYVNHTRRFLFCDRELDTTLHTIASDCDAGKVMSLAILALTRKLDL